MEKIKVLTWKVGNWNEIPEVWKNTNEIKKLKYANDPKDSGLATLLKPFVGGDGLKPALTGVNFDKNGITATNGNVMIHLPEPNKDFNGIYPMPYTKAGTDKSGRIDEKYPDYLSAFPVSQDEVHKISCYKLLQYCRVAVKFANRTTFQVRFKTNDEIGLSGRILIDAMETLIKMGYKEVYAHFTAHNRPLLFSPVKNPKVGKDIMILMMPIVIKYLESGGDVGNFYGTMDLDYEHQCSVYYDFTIDAIVNQDGSVADFKMYYGEYTVLSKDEMAALKSCMTKNPVIPILENVCSDGENIFSTNLEAFVLVKNKFIEEGVYYILDDAIVKEDVDTDEYPVINKDIKSKESFITDKGFLNHAFSLLSPFVSKDELKYHLTGILFEKANNKMSFTATNEDIIGRIDATRFMKHSVQKDLKTIIPVSDKYKIMPAFCNVTDSPVTMSLITSDKSKDVLFESAEAFYWTRDIDGKFPDYQQILPSEFTSKFVVNKEDINKLINTSKVKEFVKQHKYSTPSICFIEKENNICEVWLMKHDNYGSGFNHEKIVLGNIKYSMYNNTYPFNQNEFILFVPDKKAEMHLPEIKFSIWYSNLIKLLALPDTDLNFLKRENFSVIDSAYIKYEPTARKEEKKAAVKEKKEAKIKEQIKIINKEEPPQSSPEPQAEPTRKDYVEAIEGLKAMLEFVSGDDRKQYEEAIDGLETMLEFLPKDDPDLPFEKGGRIKQNKKQQTSNKTNVKQQTTNEKKETNKRLK